MFDLFLATCTLLIGGYILWRRLRKPTLIGSAAWLSYTAFPDQWKRTSQWYDEYTDGELSVRQYRVHHDSWMSYSINDRRVPKWEVMRILKPLRKRDEMIKAQKQRIADQKVLDEVLVKAQTKLKEMTK